MIHRFLCRLGIHGDIVEVIERRAPTPEGGQQSSYTACRSCGRRC